MREDCDVSFAYRRTGRKHGMDSIVQEIPVKLGNAGLSTRLPHQHRVQADQHRCPHCDLGRVWSRARARRAQVVGIESQRSLALLRVYSTWFGLAAPNNVPVDIIDRLNKAVNDGLADSKLNAQLRDITGVPMPGSPADFGQFIAEETEKWAKVIKLSGVKSE
jgi:Tripartite tricarboxylate transporter family receptor